MSPWEMCALAMVPGIATAIGTLPALAVRRLGPTVEAVLLGFGAGMMLAASFWSLLAPAIAELGTTVGRGAGLHAIAAFLLGAGAVSGLNALTPHEHPSKGREGIDLVAIRRTWLFVTAITLHNIPEGLAVGVGLGSGEPAISVPVVLGIALQNLPEGLVVAMSLLRVGWSRGRAVLVGIASGAIEPFATAVGFAAVAAVSGLLPYALAAAAGAMVYVVSGEVIPESHRGPASEPATWGTLVGFAAMTWLATTYA